jgi:hypothetical protein
LLATLTDGATIDWNLNTQAVAKVTLAGNRAFNAPTNLVDGGEYKLRIIQDATGTRIPTFDAATYKKMPTLSTAAGSVDVLYFECIGTYLRCTGVDLELT